MDEGRLIEEGFRELRSAMNRMEIVVARLSDNVAGLKDRVEFQNGRVGKLEAVNALRELAEAQARGRAEGRAGVVLTKRQLAAIAAAMMALVSAGSGIATLLVKLL